MAGRYLPARLKVYLTSLQRLCDLRLIKCSGFFSFFKGSSTWPHVRLQWFISGGRKKTCWSGYFPHMMKAIFMFFFVLILAPFCWVFCLYKNNYLKPHILPSPYKWCLYTVSKLEKKSTFQFHCLPHFWEIDLYKRDWNQPLVMSQGSLILQ